MRIVRDSFAGYEVQVKFWWLPFIWLQKGGLNTFSTLDAAREFAARKRIVEDIE